MNARLPLKLTGGAGGSAGRGACGSRGHAKTSGNTGTSARLRLVYARTRGARATFVAWLVVLAASCAPDPEPIDWAYRFAPDIDRGRVRTVRASIRRLGCEPGLPLLYDEIVSPGGSAPPPLLHQGVYGFELTAADASCRVVAHRCDVVELRRGAPLVQIVGASAAERLCEVETCNAGRCGAGVTPDAGLDAGTATRCDPGFADCGAGACVSLAQDRHCGTCGNDCAAIANADGGCVERFDARGQPYFDCAYTCRAGFYDCDGLASNGCEGGSECRCTGDVDCAFSCDDGCGGECRSGACTISCANPPCRLTCPLGTTCTAICGSSSCGGRPCESGSCTAQCVGGSGCTSS